MYCSSFRRASGQRGPPSVPQALPIPTEKSLGPNHGVYQVGAGGDAVHVVDKFWQKATVPELTAAGLCGLTTLC